MIDKVPFRRYTLDEDVDKKQRMISLRLNESEQADLEVLKDMFQTDQDGTAIKTAMRVGLNVLQSTFGVDLLRYLSSSKRVRR